MTPQQLAEKLTDGTDLAAAALLVAIWSDDNVAVPREDLPLVRELEELGCLREGRIVELGSRTAIRLRGMGIGGRED